MDYAVELFIKQDQAQPIRRLFQDSGSVLTGLGASPHISFAVFPDVNVGRLTPVVQRLAEQTPPLTVRFSSIGMFPGKQNVVFLAPVVTPALLEAHAFFHAKLKEQSLPCHPYYLPDTWVPHCTITMAEPIVDALHTIERLHNANALGEVVIDEVHIVRYSPAESLAAFRLGEVPATDLCRVRISVDRQRARPLGGQRKELDSAQPRMARHEMLWIDPGGTL